MATCETLVGDASCCPSWDSYPSGVQERALALAWSTIEFLTAGLVNCRSLTAVIECEGWCDNTRAFVLPSKVKDITSVTIDDILIDPADYVLINGRRIERVDGKDWECGRTVIVYESGTVIGADGLWAVSTLACEYAKACSGDKCRLPSTVTSVTRSGVSFDLDNSMFSNGMTGIREVDAFVLSVNPHRLRLTPNVWSPDSRRVAFR